MADSKTDRVGEPKHKHMSAVEPKKVVPVKQTTSETFEQSIQKDLIDKASSFFGWTLFLLIVVFCIGFFFNGNYGLVSDVIRTLSSVLTFLLGYLFATAKR